MGRKERRLQERFNKNNKYNKDTPLDLFLKASAKQSKLRNDTVSRIQDTLMNINVSAMLNAFALYLFEHYNASDVEIQKALTWMNDTVGEIGSDKFPTVSDFKLYVASKTHAAILLTDEEMDKFDIMESKYQYIVEKDDNGNKYIQKIMVISCNDNEVKAEYIGGKRHGEIVDLPEYVCIYLDEDLIDLEKGDRYR